MHFRALLTLAAVAAASLPAAAQSLDFDFASTSGSLVVFDGTLDTISFTTGASGRDFSVSLSTGGVLDSFLGTLDGTFLVGAVTDLGSNRARASVSGTGTLSLFDAAGFAISAELTLGDIWVREISAGASTGVLNSLAEVNLSNFSGYSGTDARLAGLAGRDGEFRLTFQFNNPGMSFYDLFGTTAYPNAGVASSTYNGHVTLAAIPEPVLGIPASLAALAGLIAAGRRRAAALRPA